jgi:hypothetical protein
VCRNKRGVLMDKNKPFYWVDYRREKKWNTKLKANIRGK